MGSTWHSWQTGTTPFILFAAIHKLFAGTTYNVSAILQVGLLNVDGYYDPLLSFIDKAVEEGFIKPTARNIIVLAPTPKELIQKLEVDPLPFFFLLQTYSLFSK